MAENILKTLFEDEHLLVLDKPAGVLSIPDRYDPSITNLKTELDNKYGKIFVVHRIDKDTSGVILFAKDAETHKIMNDQFQNFKVTKLYHSLWEGIVTKDEIFIDIPLMASPYKKGMTIPSARGKEAYSKVRVLKRFKKGTLVEVELLTGRHHQIRAHALAIGHPLLVDELYGKNEAFFVSSIKRNFNLKKNTEETPILSRLSLHAKKIEFRHPHNDKVIICESDYPKDIAVAIKQLQKYSKLPEYYITNTEL
jgi:RluA family pseudouridine synthase